VVEALQEWIWEAAASLPKVLDFCFTDDFEDLGQDADALQLRQRRQTAGGNGASNRRGADDKAAAVGASAGNGASKKGR
jgi:hypothetical protein